MPSSSLIALAAAIAAAPQETPPAAASDRAVETAAAPEDAGEIVVTARRRAEALRDIPLTITAMSAEQLEDAGIRSLEDISAFAPGFNFSNQGNQRGGRSESVVRFRGMDINDVAPTRQLASVFIDGIYVSGGLASISLEDVGRVEVIKGPQSAYFGRSTFGGAVNFVSRPVSRDFGASASLELAEGFRHDLGVSVEGPLGTDRLRARITGRTFETDGRYRSIADGGELGQESTRSINLLVEADPFEGVRLRANAFFSEDEDGAPTTFALGRDRHNCGPFFPGGITYICGEVPKVRDFGTNTRLDAVTYDIFVNNSRNSLGITRGPRLDHVGLRRLTERYNASLEVDITPIDATFTAVGSYNTLTQKRILDLDFTPQNIWLESGFQDVEDWSAEARLAGQAGSFRWLVGGSVFDLQFETPNGSIAYLFPNAAFRNGFFLNQTIARTDVRTSAVFGSLGWEFAEGWTLSLEGRYQADEIDQGQVAGLDLKRTFKNFLPRAILQWQPSSTTNLYLTYAKGNKPGDFNTAVIGLTAAQKAQVREQTGAEDVVGEEELQNYEIGLKQSLLGGSLYFTAAAYYMKWKNQQNRTQATVTDPTTPAGIRAVPVIVSAGKTDLWGLELEANARLTRQWTLSGTFAWAASEYQLFLCGFCQRLVGTADMAGNESPRFPKFSGTASLAYDDKLANGMGLFGRIDAIYTGRAFDEAFNLARTANVVRFNARAGIERDFWRAELFVRNLLDNRDYTAAARFTDFTKGNFNLNDFVTNVTPAEPRQVGVRFRVSL